MAYNHIYTVRQGMGTPTKFDGKTLWQTSRQAVPALLTPALLLWGIIGGFFTPTEAAGVAVIYTYVLSAFVYKQISWRDAPRLLFNMARTTGTILFIAITGKLAAWVFTYDSLPVRAAEFLGSLDIGATGILVLVFFFLIIVGMFMDAVAAIFILVPVLLPAMVRLGVDPIHFIVILVIALALGLITPPVGVCLFAAAQISDMKIERVIKASWPLFIVLGGGIFAMVLLPKIILYPMQLVGMYP
jgi:tripartite ATP-independent transporter DctM subunit